MEERIVSHENKALEKLIGQQLKEKGWTLATAESCTGGLIASKITSVAGSSAYYRGAIVAYHAVLKREFLGVSAQLIEKYTVVSRSVAEAMAEGVRKRFQSDIALSTTGVAGPTKGEDGREIGTLCIGLSTKNHIESHEFRLGCFERKKWIDKASVKALEILYLYLLNL